MGEKPKTGDASREMDEWLADAEITGGVPAPSMQPSGLDQSYRLRVRWSLLDIFLYFLLWLFLISVTLGIALFFAPYAWTAKFINGTEVYDSSNRTMGVLKSDIRISEQIGHIVKWILLSAITLGFALPFYMFGVIRTVINRTVLVDAFEVR